MGRYLIGGLISLPFLFLGIWSLGREWIFPAVLPRQLSLENWRYLLASQSDLGQSLLLSMLISLSIAVVVTMLSFWVSKMIAYHRWRSRLLLLAYFPYVFAPVILAACLQYYFLVMGLSGNIAGVLLAQMLIAFPFGVIFFMGFWNERMLAMEQLAATLGSNSWQTYWRVLLPVSRGALLVCFFQSFLISWFEYGLTTLIGVGKVQTLTLKVFQYVNEANLFLAALASCLLAIPPVVLLWLNKRYVFKEEVSNLE